MAILKKYLSSKDYISTTAVFLGYTTIKTDNGDVKRPVYEFSISDKKYQILKEFESSSSPKIGATENIKYNPNDPKDAVFSGIREYQSNVMVICLGLLFTLLPLLIMVENKVFKTIVKYFLVLAFIGSIGYFFYISYRKADFFPIVFFSLIFISIIYKNVQYQINQSRFKKFAGDDFENQSAKKQVRLNENYNNPIGTNKFSNYYADTKRTAHKMFSITRYSLVIVF